MLGLGAGRVGHNIRLLCTEVWPVVFQVLTLISGEPIHVWSLGKAEAIEQLKRKAEGFALVMQKLLIWDFDGTLAYRDGMWSGAMVDVLDRHQPGHGITREHVRPYLRNGFPWHNPEASHLELSNPDAWWGHLQPVFASAYTALGISAPRAAELACEVRGCYANPAAWSVYSDVPDALAQLQEDGWTQVVLSNHIPELELLMAALRLRASFEAVYSSAVIGYEKPNPRAFRYVLDATGSSGTVWMIGDNPVADIAGAATIGIPGILVRSDSEEAPISCTDVRGIRTLISGQAPRMAD